MEDAHHLFGNAACTSDIFPGFEILEEGVGHSPPVRSPVTKETLVFGHEDGLAQEQGNGVQFG
jgi:hypothetical protein